MSNIFRPIRRTESFLTDAHREQPPGGNPRPSVFKAGAIFVPIALFTAVGHGATLYTAPKAVTRPPQVLQVGSSHIDRRILSYGRGGHFVVSLPKVASKPTQAIQVGASQFDQRILSYGRGGRFVITLHSAEVPPTGTPGYPWPSVFKPVKKGQPFLAAAHRTGVTEPRTDGYPWPSVFKPVKKGQPFLAAAHRTGVAVPAAPVTRPGQVVRVEQPDPRGPVAFRGSGKLLYPSGRSFSPSQIGGIDGNYPTYPSPKQISRFGVKFLTPHREQPAAPIDTNPVVGSIILSRQATVDLHVTDGRGAKFFVPPKSTVPNPSPNPLIRRVFQSRQIPIDLQVSYGRGAKFFVSPKSIVIAPVRKAQEILQVRQQSLFPPSRGQGKLFWVPKPIGRAKSLLQPRQAVLWVPGKAGGKFFWTPRAITRRQPAILQPVQISRHAFLRRGGAILGPVRVRDTAGIPTIQTIEFDALFVRDVGFDALFARNETWDALFNRDVPFSAEF